VAARGPQLDIVSRDSVLKRGPDMSESAESAIADLYAAILAPAGWPLALQSLARTVDALGMVVFPPYAAEIGQTFLQLPASPELREPMTAFINEGWWLQDHRAKRARRLVAGGRQVIFEHDVASDEDRKKMPVYDEFYRRFDMPWFAAAMFEADDAVWSATFLRSQSQGPFGATDVAALRSLRTHLQRAVDLATRTSALIGTTAVDLFDALDFGAVLLDRRGVIVHANRNARTVFGSGLDVVVGRLVASDPAANADLQALLEAASMPRFPPGAARPVPIPRAGKRPLVVEAVPVAPDIVDDPLCVLRSILLITDLGQSRAFRTSQLRDVFHLTNAEAKLAARLAGGEDLDAAAAVLGVTWQTARSQLKSIFAKTDTHRQAELVALLARIRG
jgi:DNA-binding CsgD family transcriptional regulator